MVARVHSRDLFSFEYVAVASVANPPDKTMPLLQTCEANMSPAQSFSLLYLGCSMKRRRMKGRGPKALKLMCTFAIDAQSQRVELTSR